MSTGLGRLAFVTAVLAVALLLGACSGGEEPGRVFGPGQTLHPCALPSISDVESALGELRNVPEPSRPDPVASPFRECVWTGSRGVLQVSLATDATLRSYEQPLGRSESDHARFATVPGQRVSGLGVPAKRYRFVPAQGQKPAAGFYQVALLAPSSLVLLVLTGSDSPDNPATVMRLAREALPALSQ